MELLISLEIRSGDRETSSQLVHLVSWYKSEVHLPMCAPWDRRSEPNPNVLGLLCGYYY